ncbi:MAG: preprotein translocase subunit SecG [Pyrinomonadaceae bacterium]
MLVTLLYILFFLSCIVLVATILLQPGKSDAGALFTSNISSSAFGPRGTQSVLSRVTISAAILFMLSALMLSMPAITGDFSVLNSAPAATETTVPINPQPDMNTNNSSVVPAETNTNAITPASPAANENATTNK